MFAGYDAKKKKKPKSQIPFWAPPWQCRWVNEYKNLFQDGAVGSYPLFPVQTLQAVCFTVESNVHEGVSRKHWTTSFRCPLKFEILGSITPLRMLVVSTAIAVSWPELKSSFFQSSLVTCLESHWENMPTFQKMALSYGINSKPLENHRSFKIQKKRHLVQECLSPVVFLFLRECR